MRDAPAASTIARSAAPATRRKPALPKNSATVSFSTVLDKTPIATYQFSCGTGTTLPPQTAPTTTCTYPAAGTFIVKVVVTDTGGLTGTTTKSVKVQ